MKTSGGMHVGNIYYLKNLQRRFTVHATPSTVAAYLICHGWVATDSTSPHPLTRMGGGGGGGGWGA